MVPTDIHLHDLVIAGHRTASLTIHLERCGRRVARPRQRLRNGQRPSRRARRRRPPDRHLSRQPPVKASPQGDVSGGGSGCGPPVVTGIQVPPPPGGADQSPGYHSSHMGPGDSHLCRGTTATSPEHPAASPAPVPQPYLDLPGVGRWQTRELEETGGNSCSSPFPAGDGRRPEGGRPDARRQAGRTVRGGGPGQPGLPSLTDWSVSGTVIKEYIFMLTAFFRHACFGHSEASGGLVLGRNWASSFSLRTR